MLVKCPVCGMAIGELTPEGVLKSGGQAAPHCEACWRPLYDDLKSVVRDGRTYYFCSAGCKAAFELSPQRYVSTAGA